MPPPTAEIPNNLMAKWQSDTARGRRAARRPITACQTCRASKVKCDGRRRCSHCTARGVACVYAYPRATSSSTAKPGGAVRGGGGGGGGGHRVLENPDAAVEDGCLGGWPALLLPPPPPTWTDLSADDDGGAALLLRDAATHGGGGGPTETPPDYGAGEAAAGVSASEMCCDGLVAVYDDARGCDGLMALGPQLPDDPLGGPAALAMMGPAYQDVNSGAYLQNNGILDCERTLLASLSVPVADQYASPGR